VVDPLVLASVAGSRDDHAGGLASGVRHFTGIAKRRRTSAQLAGWPSVQAGSGAPGKDEAILPSKAQV
jgi:hypothetical protein